jgi:hypothetical protein
MLREQIELNSIRNSGEPPLGSDNRQTVGFRRYLEYRVFAARNGKETEATCFES